MTNKELAAKVAVLQTEVATLKEHLEKLLASPAPEPLARAVQTLKEIVGIESPLWRDLIISKKTQCIEMRLPREKYGKGKAFMNTLKEALEKRGHKAGFAHGCLQVVLKTTVAAMPPEVPEADSVETSVI